MMLADAAINQSRLFRSRLVAKCNNQRTLARWKGIRIVPVDLGHPNSNLPDREDQRPKAQGIKEYVYTKFLV